MCRSNIGTAHLFEYDNVHCALNVCSQASIYTLNGCINHSYMQHLLMQAQGCMYVCECLRSTLLSAYNVYIYVYHDLYVLCINNFQSTHVHKRH